MIVLAGSMGSAFADSYPLVNGATLEGDPIAFGKDGVAVKKPDGTFSEKVGWTNFTQVGLKKLAALPKAQPFVEPFLEPDDPDSSGKTAEIKLKPVPRLPRPDPQAGLGSIFASPLSATLLFILYLANLYAGYEISVFRAYPPGLVCGLAALAPVLTPIIFLSLPTRKPPTPEQLVRQQMTQDELDEAAELAEALSRQEGETRAAPGAPDHPPPTVYQRGKTSFNRRFFETKLSGFLRMVPSDAEKDMVICIRSARGEHVGQRISRMLPNELALQVYKGGASSDVIIPYSEIQEVQIRHKDA